uniref:Tight junction-associated protein 1 domain-containing protein n=1 Tax=Gadus morhua TaxID=8049 RepID=A0A8C5FQR2_GADMO
MTGPGAPRPNGGAPGGQHNGSAGRRPETPLTPGGGGGEEGVGAGGRGGNSSSSSSSFEKLSPYPAPPPPHHPHPLYPGRKVIEFTSDDKVKIPKNSPLPNCTYATRQAISLSLVQADAPPSPAHSDSGWRSAASSSSSPSPPQPPSSASSEEDLLLSWQRMFVQKEAPPAALQHRTSFSRDSARQLGLGGASGGGGAAERQRGGVAAYSDGEEGSSAPREGEEEEEEGGSVGSWAEERDVLPCDLPVITPTRHLEYPPDHAPPPPPAPGYTPPGRGQKNPKRMGVHHLHRKDSLTRAQEQGTLHTLSPSHSLTTTLSVPISVWVEGGGVLLLRPLSPIGQPSSECSEQHGATRTRLPPPSLPHKLSPSWGGDVIVLIYYRFPLMIQCCY